MKVLFIGGTGNISAAVSSLAVSQGIELTLLNRGNRSVVPGAKIIACDINDVSAVSSAIRNEQYDSVVNWIAFSPKDIERDIRLFEGHTSQYVFISSASAYQKPPSTPIITESTPLSNPYWEYSRNKIVCEEKLQEAYRQTGFPAVTVRPSLTYNTLFPIALGGWGCYTLAKRILDKKPIVVHGDGTSLWTVTHADDFAKGFIPLLGNPAAIGHAFHITSDELLTWDQIYQTIAHALGEAAHIVHVPSDFITNVFPDMTGTLLGDKSHSAIFDNSKIKQFVPGFRATIPFHQGIRRTLAWFDADPARKIINEAESQMLDTILNRYGHP
ncbi:MAG: SDR family oxidoreductase [Deltaproteobacteria bacterium]|nr:SDR family oxidoreductase [Deltaproteobacteria bacterium]MBN2671420.1 SDR family oxidoreductase [Deltaproteobacteria bacterium]